MKDFCDGKIRFTALSDKVFRVELDKFVDENTLNIPDRGAYEKVDFSSDTSGDKYVFTVGGMKVVIDKNAKDFRSLCVLRGGETIYKYRKAKFRGELPSVGKTPFVFALEDIPQMIIPESGYSAETAESGEKFVYDTKAKDIYLICADKDFALLRREYIKLTGCTPVPTLSVFGLIFSKWYPYSEAEALAKIKEFKDKGLPLDVLVIDTDWREISDLTFGCGYKVNEKLLPDLKRLFKAAHKEGVEILFNDHPVPTEGARSVFDKGEMKFRAENLKKILEMGLDIWWFDRNWMFNYEFPDQPMSKEVTGMFVFHDVTERHYKRRANSDKVYKRPVILANISQIKNGEYVGIRESASHRYPFQWSGDIKCDLFALRQEVANMIKCSNSMISYYSSDIGGHVTSTERDDFIRWYQYGCLSPILRPHSTLTAKSREPWAYDEECERIVSSFIKMRTRLLPVLYARAHENVADGLGVVSPVGFFYPEDKATYGDLRSYMIGKDLFVSPLTTERSVEDVTEGDYVGKVKATYYLGRLLEGAPIFNAELDRIDFYCYNGEQPLKGVPAYEFSAKFEFKLKFKVAKKLFITSDDGVRVFINGVKKVEDWSDHAMTEYALGEFDPERTYDFMIEYYQGGGDAGLKLSAQKSAEKPARRYVPQGKWIDVFTGKKIVGGRKIKLDRPLDKMPLFIKEGAILPLNAGNGNAKSGIFDDMLFEYYPSFTMPTKGRYFEDDGVTTAYKHGGYLTYDYEAEFDEASGKFVVILGGGKGEYLPERTTKKVRFKVALTDKFAVRRVTVNGRDIKLKNHNKRKGAYPFVDRGFSPAFKTVTFDFTREYDEDVVVEIYTE